MRKRHGTTAVSCVLVLIFVVAAASADVTLPGVFTAHAVLQRDRAIPVWGWADPGEQVTITLGDQTKTAAADAEGKWSVRLDAMQAGGPYTLKVAGKNTIELEDVMLGEVWICSGQSNMAWTVSNSLNPDEERAAADYPRIRMFTVDRVPAETPQETCGGRWQVCSPETVGGFSAVAYFFGRELHKELDVPVGLINTSWGGTPIQAWTSLAAQRAHEELHPMLDDWQRRVESYDPDQARRQYEKLLARWEEEAAKAKAEGKPAPRRPNPPSDPRTSPHRPANLYNGMVAPLAPYAIRGAIWYQGESNAGVAGVYGLQLDAMIRNWREIFQVGDFPFAWVQLANFMKAQEQPSEGGWAWIREQMLQSLAIPNTGMAVIIDIGEADDIHPRNKQDVGRRLALWALAAAYGKDIVYSGPMYQSMKVEGDKAVLRFDHLGGGLVAGGGEKLKGFAIAGPDRSFVWADARIEGDTVVVSSPEVKQPAAVRYGWANNPDCNLSNRAGLPASPFRTDRWEE
jgi:sialate O-acetylesterase